MRAQIADFDSQLASAQAEADAKSSKNAGRDSKIAQSKSENQTGNVSSANQVGPAANTGTTKPTGGNTTPSTGNTTTPSTGNVSTTTPSTGNTGTATPTTGNTGTTTKPSTGNSSNTSKPDNASAGQKIANKRL